MIIEREAGTCFFPNFLDIKVMTTIMSVAVTEEAVAEVHSRTLCFLHYSQILFSNVIVKRLKGYYSSVADSSIVSRWELPFPQQRQYLLLVFGQSVFINNFKNF